LAGVVVAAADLAAVVAEEAVVVTSAAGLAEAPEAAERAAIGDKCQLDKE